MMIRDKIINIIHKSALGSKITKTVLTPLVGGTFITIIILLILASLWIDKFLNLPKFIGTPLNIIVATLILAVGIFLNFWSVFHFLKARGTPVPMNPPPKVVTDGPYAYSRNPMMTGLFLLLFGIGVIFQSVSLVFIFTPLFIAIMVFELKAIEEPELEKRLGQEYIEYKKRVGMFMPRFKNS
jgi:protein-S-isoprenylcysteine O-methyltransferase Ste14